MPLPHAHTELQKPPRGQLRHVSGAIDGPRGVARQLPRRRVIAAAAARLSTTAALSRANHINSPQIDFNDAIYLQAKH